MEKTGQRRVAGTWGLVEGELPERGASARGPQGTLVPNISALGRLRARGVLAYAAICSYLLVFLLLVLSYFELYVDCHTRGPWASGFQPP